MSLELLEKLQKFKTRQANMNAELFDESEADRSAIQVALQTMADELRKEPSDEQIEREVNARNAVPSRGDDYSPSRFALTITSGADWQTLTERMNAVSKDIQADDLSVLKTMLTDQILQMNDLFSSLLLAADRNQYVSQRLAITQTALRVHASCVRGLRELERLKEPGRLRIKPVQVDADFLEVYD